METDDPIKQARARALRRLGAREYSSAELAAYLEGKGTDPRVAAQVVAELVERKLVDDSRYARIVVREQARRGKGPFYIARKLRQKGIVLEPSEIKALYDDCAETSDLDAASRIVERRYPDFAVDRAEKARAFQALLRRGFSSETARQVLSRRQAKAQR